MRLWPLVLSAALVGCGVVPEEEVEVESRVDGLADGGLVAPSDYVEVVLINDSARVARFGSVSATESDSRLRLREANTPYLQGNLQPRVQFLLKRQITFTGAEPFAYPPSSATEVDEAGLLSNVMTWWATQPEAGRAIAVLLSGRDFTGGALGLAPVGAFCDAQSVAVVQLTQTANPMAHEMGHIFGLLHDGAGNACPTSGFVMQAVGLATAPAPVVFSTCSAGAFATGFVDTPATRQCLLPAARDALATTSTCGDGVVQPGEQCDCGIWCSGDPCCNGTTCQLKAGASCSAGLGCCDIARCAPRAASENFQCRAAISACDTADVCAGSAACGDDRTVDAGTACNDGKSATNGTCFAKDCVSRWATCMDLIGDPDCPTSQAQTTCGALLCQPTGSTSCVFVSNGASVEAVPDGARCATGQQCFSGSCTISSTLPAVDLCPADANKRSPGVCGCGAPDTDTDSDGLPDCLDQCPNAPGFQSPCAADAGVDAGTPRPDGGTDGGSADAGSGDAGVFDGGTGDAGFFDAGIADAGRSDAGLFDAGAGDAGFFDAGTGDAGFFDGGSGDAGVPDGGTGSPDAGRSDAGAGDGGVVDAGPGDAGSGGNGSGDAGAADAGGGDAGATDAGGADAGGGDAGTGDAGTGDAGTGDAGTGDAGTGDAGTGDAGTDDAGPGDAGNDDAGTTSSSDGGSLSDAGAVAPADGGAGLDGGQDPGDQVPGCGCTSGVDGVLVLAAATLLRRRRASRR